MSKRFTDKENSTTAGRRRVLSEVTRNADEGVARWGAIYQLSGCSGGFDPGFRKADKIRFVKVYEIRQGCRVKRVKNGTSVDSADCEIRRTGV